MARRAHKRSRDTTSLLVAALVDDEGRLVKVVRAHDQYVPRKDYNSRVSNLFSLQGLPEVYVPTQANSKLHLKCANPDCKARLHYVPAHAYENDFDGNRAHFRSNRIDDHVKNCMFKNPKRESDKKLTLTQAIADEQAPVFVNIHLKTGFQGRARIGSDYMTDHARWQSDHADKPHAVIAAHTLPELVALRERVAGSGEDKLAKLFYGKNTMVLPHEHFWLAPQTEEDLVRARDNTGRPDVTPYLKVLAEFLQEVQKPQNVYLSDSNKESRLYGMTRIVAFETARAPKEFHAASYTLHGKPLPLRGVWLEQDMRMEYLKDEAWNIPDRQRRMEALLSKGRRFLVAAAPSMEFSRNPLERAKQIRQLRAIVNGGILQNDSLQNVRITWHVESKDQFMHQPYPARMPHPEYRSGAIPYGELPFDKAAAPHATIAPAMTPARPLAAEPKDPLRGIKPGTQLKLL